MSNERYKYFIELHPAGAETLPRDRAQKARRRAALDFVNGLRSWLNESGLTPKVSSMDVTLFGQILITCETDVIKHVREQDVLNIAAIRQAATWDKLALAKNRLSA